MPIRKKIIKADAPAVRAADPMPPPPAYDSGRALFSTTGIPAISSRDLHYFFNLAASLYKEVPLPSEQPVDGGVNDDPPPPFSDLNPNPTYTAGGGGSGIGTGIGSNNSYQAASPQQEVDPTAVLVLRLFRQTLTHIRPVAERFHLGPADRQPLYALTAQPSPRSAAEFNELAIKRRDAISGVWHPVCTADIEPRLNLTRRGHYKIASLTMDAVPVWRRVAAGQVTFETSETGQGNKLCLWWGDRTALGPIGDAYGLWWESGGESGCTEAFYVVEQWGGFDSSKPGIVRVSFSKKVPRYLPRVISSRFKSFADMEGDTRRQVKPALKDGSGQFMDPRLVQQDLATLFFHGDGRTAPQFVCQDVNTQTRLDFIMAGLMTVLTLETRRAEAAGGSLGAQMAHVMGLQFTGQ